MADANGIQSNSLDYAYHNAGPGSVAPASSAVGSVTETDMATLNPAFHQLNPQSGQAMTAVQDAQAGPSDRGNPGAASNLRDLG